MDSDSRGVLGHAHDRPHDGGVRRDGRQTRNDDSRRDADGVARRNYQVHVVYHVSECRDSDGGNKRRKVRRSHWKEVAPNHGHCDEWEDPTSAAWTGELGSSAGSRARRQVGRADRGAWEHLVSYDEDGHRYDYEEGGRRYRGDRRGIPDDGRSDGHYWSGERRGHRTGREKHRDDLREDETARAREEDATSRRNAGGLARARARAYRELDGAGYREPNAERGGAAAYATSEDAGAFVGHYGDRGGDYRWGTGADRTERGGAQDYAAGDDVGAYAEQYSFERQPGWDLTWRSGHVRRRRTRVRARDAADDEDVVEIHAPPRAKRRAAWPEPPRSAGEEDGRRAAGRDAPDAGEERAGSGGAAPVARKGAAAVAAAATERRRKKAAAARAAVQREALPSTHVHGAPPGQGAPANTNGLHLLVAAVTAAGLSQASESTAQPVTNKPSRGKDQRVISDSSNGAGCAIRCTVSLDSLDQSNRPTGVATFVETVRAAMPPTSPTPHPASVPRPEEGSQEKRKTHSCKNGYPVDAYRHPPPLAAPRLYPASAPLLEEATQEKRKTHLSEKGYQVDALPVTVPSLHPASAPRLEKETQKKRKTHLSEKGYQVDAYGHPPLPFTTGAPPRVTYDAIEKATQEKRKTHSSEKGYQVDAYGHLPPRLTYDDKWERRCKELEAFIRKHGHCDVPFKHASLGPWVSNQRTRYKNKKLPEDRVARLERLGLNWGQSLMCWKDRFYELVAYKAQSGTANVPARYPPNPQLGT